MAPPIEVDPANPLMVVRDSDGIALGGIRLPSVSVPVALNDGINGPVDLSNPLSVFCVLFGTHRPFDQATLDTRYPSHGSYLSKVSHASKTLVKHGFLLPEDRTTLDTAAAHSPIGN